MRDGRGARYGAFFFTERGKTTTKREKAAIIAKAVKLVALGPFCFLQHCQDGWRCFVSQRGAYVGRKVLFFLLSWPPNPFISSFFAFFLTGREEHNPRTRTHTGISKPLSFFFSCHSSLFFFPFLTQFFLRLQHRFFFFFLA